MSRSEPTLINRVLRGVSGVFKRASQAMEQAASSDAPSSPPVAPTTHVPPAPAPAATVQTDPEALPAPSPVTSVLPKPKATPSPMAEAVLDPQVEAAPVVVFGAVPSPSDEPAADAPQVSDKISSSDLAEPTAVDEDSDIGVSDSALESDRQIADQLYNILRRLRTYAPIMQFPDGDDGSNPVYRPETDEWYGEEGETLGVTYPSIVKGDKPITIRSAQLERYFAGNLTRAHMPFVSDLYQAKMILLLEAYTFCKKECKFPKCSELRTGERSFVPGLKIKMILLLRIVYAPPALSETKLAELKERTGNPDLQRLRIKELCHVHHLLNTLGPKLRTTWNEASKQAASMSPEEGAAIKKAALVMMIDEICELDAVKATKGGEPAIDPEDASKLITHYFDYTAGENRV